MDFGGLSSEVEGLAACGNVGQPVATNGNCVFALLRMIGILNTEALEASMRACWLGCLANWGAGLAGVGLEGMEGCSHTLDAQRCRQICSELSEL